ALFHTAEASGLTGRLDEACMVSSLTAFARLRLPGRLLVNLTPTSLLDPRFAPEAMLRAFAGMGLTASRMVIEITENAASVDYASLREAVAALRAAGIETALDDFGQGFSSLRMWSELKPGFVKIDKHFVAGIHQDPHKLEFVRSIRQLAESAHACVIAEGVETVSELAVLKDLGIRYAQGYFIGRPSPVPVRLPPDEVAQCLESCRVSVFPMSAGRDPVRATAGRLAVPAPQVSPDTPSQVVLDLLIAQPELHAVAVVRDGMPVGIIHRPALLDRFIGLYGRELYGKKPCAMFMDSQPLVVDKSTRMVELSELVVKKGKSAFTQGFVVTAEGRYLGLGSGFDLMREVTDMQIVAARYANPLSGLPGNVPIQEHMERLLASGQSFVAAYFDLDQFKPYNDVYGFRRGDDMIQLVASLLRSSCDDELDFVGHIGGDDFVVLFQSPDWEARCHVILSRFDDERQPLFETRHVAEGGYRSEDRRGRMDFHALVSLSIGAVQIDPTHFHHYQEVARAAADAKRMAKKIEGSALFVDQRQHPHARRLADEPAIDAA
ncbi:MAG: GGDEF domain-containing protein, partial [Burkholderiales bacterium]